MDIPRDLVCVECGGLAHRPLLPEGDTFRPGEVVPFVCEDCHHRHDVVIEDVAEEDDD